MDAHNCSFCSRVFSTSSNRLRHENLFHGKDGSHIIPIPKYHNDSKEANNSEEPNESDSESGSEHGDNDTEANDHWVEILRDACSEVEDLSKPLIREPYLSELVELMKDSAEEHFTFVREMEEDRTYEKINDLIDKYESEGYSRDEAASTAWHDRRFLVKQVIENNSDVIKKLQDGDDDDDEA